MTGHTLYRRRHPFFGLSFLIVYAAFGFDGLLHDLRAPLAAHSVSMNFTIWLEAGAAALALLAVAAAGARTFTLTSDDRSRING